MEQNNFPVNLPVKFIEPNRGIIVELEVTEQNIDVARRYMNQLVKYAETLEQYRVQWRVSRVGKKMEIIFIDNNMAENLRQYMKKMM